MRRSILIGATALLALGAMPAVAADTSPAPAMSAGSGTAMVRVLHASPDAPPVDIYLDGAKVGDPLAGLAFGALSPYVEVPAGSHAVKVCASADATVCPIDVPELVIEAGQHYTIAATGALASITPQVLTDATETVADKALVRVVHFSADTPTVDILTQDGSATVVSGLEYPKATEYLPLDPGSYDLKVCASADTTVCPLDPGALDVAAGTAYSVFAIGSLAGGSLTGVVAVDLSMEAAPSPSGM